MQLLWKLSIKLIALWLVFKHFAFEKVHDPVIDTGLREYTGPQATAAHSLFCVRFRQLHAELLAFSRQAGSSLSHLPLSYGSRWASPQSRHTGNTQCTRAATLAPKCPVQAKAQTADTKNKEELDVHWNNHTFFFLKLIRGEERSKCLHKHTDLKTT